MNIEAFDASLFLKTYLPNIFGCFASHFRSYVHPILVDFSVCFVRHKCHCAPLCVLAGFPVSLSCCDTSFLSFLLF